MTTHYLAPHRFTRAVNRVVGRLARHGVSLHGSAELSVRGRESGEWRRVPVNPLAHPGGPYLVSTRGNSAWVRNLRAAQGGRLRVGRRDWEFTSVELSDEEKPEVLRRYLERWGWEVSRMFGGLTARSTDAELLAAAPRHPVFRLTRLP
ncbi:nitroreductase family deazaflavin-dependent oxidoreductase [Streptomyces sp. JNUCC 64]